jgi:hypothetical protein
MPLVTIETRRGLTVDQKKLVFDAVHAALVTAFQIPESDRHQRIVEYEPEDFEIPPGKGDRYMVVEIDAFAGRSNDAKRCSTSRSLPGSGQPGYQLKTSSSWCVTSHARAGAFAAARPARKSISASRSRYEHYRACWR